MKLFKKFRANILPQSIHAKLFILCSLLLLIAVCLVYFAYSPTSELYGRVLSHANTKEKVVALTFDDGPNGDATLQILDILKKKHVTATFFMVGDNVSFYPRIAKLAAENGNEIENHSQHHQRYLTFEDERAIQSELLRTNQIIFDVTGQTPTYFRPPYGFRTPWALRAAQKIGFDIITWNDLTGDFKRMSAQQIKNAIVKGVHPGTIIDLHDGISTIHGINRDQLVQALPGIIDGIEAKGYRFVTVKEIVQLNGGMGGR